MERVKDVYDNIADIYDFRHTNPTTSVLRKKEMAVLKRFVYGRVLDAGCGTGHYLGVFDEIIGIDISREMLKRVKGPWRPLIQGDIESIPFSDNSFDSVICMFSVLNMCNYKKAVKEVSRVVRPGGNVVISVTSVYDNYSALKEKKSMAISPGKRRKRFRIHKHTINMHLFAKDEIVSLFSKRGLHLKYFDSLFSLVAPKWGNFKGFSVSEKIKLKLENLLPCKDYGSIYVMAFEKEL